jgi:hypothetical protein
MLTDVRPVRARAVYLWFFMLFFLFMSPWYRIPHPRAMLHFLWFSATSRSCTETLIFRYSEISLLRWLSTVLNLPRMFYRTKCYDACRRRCWLRLFYMSGTAQLESPIRVPDSNGRGNHSFAYVQPIDKKITYRSTSIS